MRLARTVAVAVTVVVVLVAVVSHGGHARSTARTAGAGGKPGATRSAANVRLPAGGPFPVGVQTVTFTDPSRSIVLPGGTSEPRPLVTTVLYPAVPGTGSETAGTDLLGDATPYTRAGPYPLVVFGPGFEQVPSTYFPLLRSWASAGYVVAGITFPLTNPQAPGGPDEEDLVNQPADMTFVIGKILADAVAPGNVFTGIVDTGAVAVAGHSDGGDSAMAAAFDTCCRDATLKAAIILSGEELHEATGSYYPPGSPALLAVQGTADTVNPPSFTETLYDEDTAGPKYELMLQGAGPLDPYATTDSYDKVVSAVTLDFLDAYLKGLQSQLADIGADGTASGLATLTQSVPSTSTTQPSPTSTAGTPSSGSSAPSVTNATLAPGETTTTIFIPTEG